MGTWGRPGGRSRVLVATLAVAALGATFAPSAGAASHHHRLIRLTGKVTDQNGHAIADANVHLGAVLAPATAFGLGLTCALSFFYVPPACIWNVDTRTSRTGAFTLAVDPTWMVGKPGGSDVLIATGHAPASGLTAAKTSLDETVPSRDRSLGTIVVWQPAVAVGRSNGQYAIDTPTAPTSGATMSASLLDTSGNVAWHLALNAQGHTNVDEHVFEDGAPVLQVAANTKHIRYTAWGVRVPTIGTPTSRGLACSTYRKGGVLGAITNCPYTNGKLAQPMNLTTATKVLPQDACSYSSDCTTPNTMVVDLGQIRMLDALVWRGCSDCGAEVSLDGQVWSAWPDATTTTAGKDANGDTDAVVTGPQIPIRYVRVQGDVFLFWRLRQLSVWTSPLPVAGAL